MRRNITMNIITSMTKTSTITTMSMTMTKTTKAIITIIMTTKAARSRNMESARSSITAARHLT